MWKRMGEEFWMSFWMRKQIIFGMSFWMRKWIIFLWHSLDDKSGYCLDRNLSTYSYVNTDAFVGFLEAKRTKSQKYLRYLRQESIDRGKYILWQFLKTFEMTKHTNSFRSKDCTTYSYVDKSKVCPENVTGKTYYSYVDGRSTTRKHWSWKIYFVTIFTNIWDDKTD